MDPTLLTMALAGFAKGRRHCFRPTFDQAIKTDEHIHAHSKAASPTGRANARPMQAAALFCGI
jgi:hypothetical protein